MKIKEFFYGLGIRPPTREFTFDIQRFRLAREGEVEFAVWRHPAEKPKDFTQASVDAIRGFLSAGDYAIDIGAHTGDSVLPIALAVGPTGGVIALEPNPYVYKVLLANAGLNRRKANIYPLMFAATSEDGDMEFEYSDAGFCNGGLHKDISPWRHAHFFKLNVQGRNLQAFLEREYPEVMSRVRYIKIDAEGYDPDVVRSIRGLLEKNHPFIKTEIYKHLPSDRRIAYFRDLHQLGYRLHKWESDQDYHGQLLSEKDVDNWRHYDIFAVPV
jgi:FkbM family methyltransferase